MARLVQSVSHSCQCAMLASNVALSCRIQALPLSRGDLLSYQKASEGELTFGCQSPFFQYTRDLKSMSHTLGMTTSFAPNCSITDSNVQYCSLSTNSQAPSCLFDTLQNATPTVLLLSGRARVIAMMMGASVFSLLRNSSSSKAVSFPGLALLQWQDLQEEKL